MRRPSLQRRQYRARPESRPPQLPISGGKFPVVLNSAGIERRHPPLDERINELFFRFVAESPLDSLFRHRAADPVRAQVLQDANPSKPVILYPRLGITFRKAPIVEISVVFKTRDRAINILLP